MSAIRQLGIGGPVLRVFGLPTTLIGGFPLPRPVPSCAFAWGIGATIVVVASNVITTNDTTAKPTTVEFLFENFITKDRYGLL